MATWIDNKGIIERSDLLADDSFEQFSAKQEVGLGFVIL